MHSQFHNLVLASILSVASAAAHAIVGGVGIVPDGSRVVISYTKTTSDYGVGAIADQIAATAVCTGTIVPQPLVPGAIIVSTSKYILTGKGCLPTALDSSNKKFKNFSVYFNRNTTTDTVVIRSSTTGLALIPGTIKYDVLNFWPVGEVAIIEVSSNVADSIPKPIAGVDAVYNQLLTNSGFGQTSLAGYTTFGSLRSASYKVTSVSPAAVSVVSAIGTTYPCTGDLGSPVYADLDGKSQIFGVFSTQNCLSFGGLNNSIITPTNYANTASINNSMVPTYTPALQQLYLAFFARPADPAGLNFWASILQNSGAPRTIAGLYKAYGFDATVTSVVDGFSTSLEFNQLYPAGTPPALFVQNVYKNLRVRAADPAEINSWVEALTASPTPITKGRAALGIADEVLRNAYITDQAAVWKRTKIATSFTETALRQNKGGLFNDNADAQIMRETLTPVDSTTDVNVYQATVEAKVATIN